MKKRSFFLYALYKPFSSLRQNYRLYRQKAKYLDKEKRSLIEASLTKLQGAILEGKHSQAQELASSLEKVSKEHLPRTSWDRFQSFLGSIFFALIIALVIRQMWFEIYRIPSGSMRPTLKEQDWVAVSKTKFSINTLHPTGHLSFNPALIQRGSIVVFSVANMDIPDADTMHFYVIPGKKQYVKRLIGKPGDILYFHGGQIYGIDQNGQELKELRKSEWAQQLEHIPFIRFEGKMRAVPWPLPSVVFYQMNEPIAQLSSRGEQLTKSEMDPRLSSFKDYFELWGIQNFAMSRLLTPQQMRVLYPQEKLPIAPLYCELTHHPSIHSAFVGRDEYGRQRPRLGTSVSLIPLDHEKINTLMQHMTTCRFHVKKGIAYRYGSSYFPHSAAIHLPVPDGTYEIQNGKVYRILGGNIPLGGIASLQSTDHPLLHPDPLQVQTLYNLGIEFDSQFAPSAKNSPYPSRYAYFREGDLYLLGHPIVKKHDPLLQDFHQREIERKTLSSSYHPFQDLPPPLTANGEIDRAFIETYGVRVPEKMYLMLGDNHAMSADSRQFGFVPQDNLRGCASFILWPPGNHWGIPPQPSAPFLQFPNLLAWSVFLCCMTAYELYLRKTYKPPLSFPV